MATLHQTTFRPHPRPSTNLVETVTLRHRLSPQKVHLLLKSNHNLIVELKTLTLPNRHIIQRIGNLHHLQEA